MVELNIKKALQDHGVSGVEVEHSDVSSAHPGAADVFFLARDIADGLTIPGARVVVLDSIIDADELHTKVGQVVEELGLK